MNKEEIKYVTPKVRAVEICALTIICLSGNESMREEDFGDGGFSEE